MPNKLRSGLSGSNTSMYSQGRGRRFSPLMLIGIIVPAVLLIIGGSVFAWYRVASHAAAAAAVNPNCTLLVPAHPLSAAGLATPYQLSAPDAAANGPCNEANANQSAFVQGVIYDPATGAFSVYNPLVIDAGTQPAVAPTAPTLPANAVVGLWFGFNGTNLTLKAAGNSLNQGRCVNGLNGSVFGQFAYCNAVNFFASAKRGIAAGLVKVPALAMAKDGMPCLTSRDFGLIDQDQSDNVQTQYIANGNGQTAQFSAANQAAVANGTTIANPSDNALLTAFVDPALGCTPWTAPNLADNNAPVSALALDEIMANADQAAPIALVPLTDPMTLNNANASQRKTNLYRAGTDQPAGNNTSASGTTYCQNFFTTGLARLKLDMPLTINATSPVPAAANSLFTFLAMRYNQSFTNLNCTNLINQANPVTLQLDGNGVVIGATFAGATTGTGTGTGTGTTGAGGVQQVATGQATIALDTQAGNAAVTLALNYPNHPNQKINVNLVPNSCTGTAAFTQAEDTDGNSAVNANTVINGLQGLTALPANWFFTVTDPTQAAAPVVGCGSVTANGVNGTAVLGTVATTCPTTGTTGAPTTVAATPTTAATAPTTVATTPTTTAAAPTTVAATPTTTAAAPTTVAATPTTTATTPCTTATTTAGNGGTTVTATPTAPASAGQVTSKNQMYGNNRKHKKW